MRLDNHWAADGKRGSGVSARDRVGEGKFDAQKRPPGRAGAASSGCPLSGSVRDRGWRVRSEHPPTSLHQASPRTDAVARPCDPSRRVAALLAGRSPHNHGRRWHRRRPDLRGYGAQKRCARGGGEIAIDRKCLCGELHGRFHFLSGGRSVGRLRASCVAGLMAEEKDRGWRRDCNR